MRFGLTHARAGGRGANAATFSRMKVAFLGLGVMGAPMAGHLAAKGHDVTVYNRTAVKAAAWLAQHSGASRATPREAVAGCELIFSCVGNDDDVRAVVLGPEGAFAGMSTGAILIDHTTTSAALARELFAEAIPRGFGFIDAPVSGGQAGAVAGTLAVMCGGDEAPFERARPVIESYARACTRIGPAGAGQLTKMLNQICIAGVVQGLAEAVSFGLHAGLDMERAMGVISKGAAQSWQLENRWRTMVEGKFDFGFAVDWMRKDLGICLDEARRNGAQLPLSALVDQLYARVQARGGRRWDTSSLVEPLEKP